MPPYATEFLVKKIVGQARSEGVPLSEVEQKMLYFSETSSTLPDTVEVNGAFERQYDQETYEKKIVNLIRHIRTAERSNEAETRAWHEAVSSIREEDYYLLVMIDAALRRERPRGESIKLVGTAILVVCIALLVAFFANR